MWGLRTSSDLGGGEGCVLRSGTWRGSLRCRPRAFLNQALVPPVTRLLIIPSVLCEMAWLGTSTRPSALGARQCKAQGGAQTGPGLRSVPAQQAQAQDCYNPTPRPWWPSKSRIG